MSGCGAPFCTATTMDDVAMSTMLPATILPPATKSQAPEADTIATSATSPSPSCFSSRNDGPSITSRWLPVARSKDGDSSSKTIFIAVVLSTLMSIATAQPLGVAALRDHVDQRRRAGAYRFETALDRGEQVARLLDLHADTAAGGDHLLVVRRRLELRQRHRVRLGGIAVGKHVEGRRAHRVPGLIVGNDGQRRQAFRAADIMERQRIAEHVGAVTDHRNHFALGRGKLGAQRCAETEAEAAGKHA